MSYVKSKSAYLQEIEKSKFYGVIIPLENKDEVKDYLVEIKKEYPKANHYCYAYRFDGIQHSSDDKEPSGTAGRPILEALINKDIDNALLIVVRYFGGIKLGAGGLLRAYNSTANQTINSATILEKKKLLMMNIEVDYSYFDLLKSYLNKEEIIIENIEYNEKISIVCGHEKDYLDDIFALLNGKVSIKRLEDKNLFVEIK